MGTRYFLCNVLTFDLDFSNSLSKLAIERLAEVDEYEVVRELQVAIKSASPDLLLIDSRNIMLTISLYFPLYFL